MIRRDVSRTFPDHVFFQSPDGLRSLERVLKAVSSVYADLPYCQGMNYLCGVLVIYCNDEVKPLNIKEPKELHPSIVCRKRFG
mgnify:FL=1